jgi:signal transduction histidine kinase
MPVPPLERDRTAEPAASSSWRAVAVPPTPKGSGSRSGVAAAGDGDAVESLAAPRILPGMLGLAAVPIAAHAAAAALGWPAWQAGTTAAGCGLVAALVVAQRAARELREAYVRPLKRVLESLDDLRRGRPGSALRESGAPLAQALARAINQARADIEHRQRQSQASLMTAEAAFDRIHSVLHSLNEGVILVNVRDCVVLANPCARRLLDGGGAPIEGRPLVDLVAAELRGPLQRGLEQVRQDEGHEQVQVVGVQVGNRLFDVTMVSAQSTRLDQTFGTVVSLVDVTRNHEIARLKEQFISSISHELRTPLTNICAFAEILGQEQAAPAASDKDWREFVDIISVESQRLKGLVEDILEHSRLQMGQAQWSHASVDLRAVARSAIGKCRSRAESLGIDLATPESESDATAWCDREAVDQVLSRLLDNALKFTPRGGAVRVRVAPLDGAVEVAVTDSGPGIAPEHRETVFERFSQMGDPMTEKPAGAGLGLPICRSLVDGMGGAMWCEESDLGGAQLRFVLPATAAAAAGRL